MTERQVLGFYRALEHRDRAARADRIEDVAMGMGGGKQLPRVLKDLRKR